MTLSILIPVFNFDVTNLVKNLHKQCEAESISYEILLVDDCSTDNSTEINEQLESLDNVSFEKLKVNIGRSKIRNYLVSKAQFENCLILDCDIAIPLGFIKKYLENIDGSSVIVGGHKYQKQVPNDSRFVLHWKYGTEVECKTLKDRRKNPYDSFMTNSFLVPKKIFDKVKFDETLVRYGHEDTLFGIELEKAQIKIKHIGNPVLHLGLKTAKEFLKGEREAIRNLIAITQNREYREAMYKKSKLLFFEKSKLLKTFYSSISLYYKDRLYRKLLGENPSLIALNYWKYYTLQKLRNQ